MIKSYEIYFEAILKLVLTAAMSDQSPFIRESSWLLRTDREEVAAEVERLHIVCDTFRITAECLHVD